MKDYRRIQKILKAVKAVRDLQTLLKSVRDAQKQIEALKDFRRENESFLRSLSPEDLEEVREEAGYDKQAWEQIVHELFD